MIIRKIAKLADQKANKIASWLPPALLPRVTVAIFYIIAYVVLDRLTFLHPFSPVGITPWDPPQGLTMAVLLRFGLRYAPLVPVAMGLGEFFVRHLAAPWMPILPSTLSVLLTAGGYILAAAVLKKLCRLDPNLRRIRDVLLFITVSFVMAQLVACSVVGNFVAFGMILSQDFWSAVLRSWLGDFVGILTVAPLLLIATRPKSTHHQILFDATTVLGVVEGILQTLFVIGTVWFIFRFGFALEIKIFYLAFLPLLWFALRHGIVGAAASILLTQIALKITFQLHGYGAATVIDFQLLMVTLGVTTLLVGAIVSDRSQVSQALHESEGRLRAIWRTAPVAIITLDQNGIIESANPVAQQVFCWPSKDLIGMPIQRLLPDLSLTDATPGEICGLHQDGSRFSAEVNIDRTDGTFGLQYIVTTRDISRRVKAEALVRQHQIELAHVGRVSMVGEMASAIAHEESQPLAAIAAYARACRLLLQAPAPDLVKISLTVDKLAAQTLRAGAILNRLREFLHRGEITLVPESAADIVNEVAELGRPDVHVHDTALRVDIEPDLPPVLADRIHVQQVLLNLIRNAIDAISDSSVTVKEVKISVWRQANRVHFAVRDTGPDIDPSVVAELFTPFSTTKLQGMGLGLSISRTIIAAHGSQLRYVPGDAPGAAFHFDLQVANV